MALDENVLEFNEKGLLPPGCHEITLHEIKSIFVDGFSDSQTRQSRYECFLKMYKELLFNVKSCISLLIDGSFVTNKLNPYDIDLVIVVDYSKLTEYEAFYLNNIYEYKKKLRIEYDNIKDEVDQGKISYSKLYDLELYRLGCDFFILPEYPQSHELYDNYINQLNYWIGWWGKTRDNSPKGFLNLIVDYGVDLNEL